MWMHGWSSGSVSLLTADQLHSWIVKVQPNAVFVPTRLRHALKNERLRTNDELYVDSCRPGLQGPLTVLSQKATKHLSQGVRRCAQHLTHGPCDLSDDSFVKTCLLEVLHVHRANKTRATTEGTCHAPDGWRSCRPSWVVAFHPFHTLLGYHKCWANAMS